MQSDTKDQGTEAAQEFPELYYYRRISNECADSILPVIAAHLTEVTEVLQQEQLSICELITRLVEGYGTIPKFTFDESSFSFAQRRLDPTIAYLQAAHNEFAFLSGAYDWTACRPKQSEVGRGAEA